jgi:NAD(P)-dependent dehydrogenase (short-subunit alcohol dehydrogenase family)
VDGRDKPGHDGRVVVDVCPMRSVVITGASTGIGWSTAKVLLANGFHVFGSVRRAEDAARLKAELGAGFTPLLFDVTDEAAVAAAVQTVGEALQGERLAGLVNNAGVAVPGPLLELPIEEFRRQIEINLTGQVIVTQAFAPLLGTDPARRGPPGRIVMMSSVSGRRGMPFLAPYAASKHGLEGLSESLRRELMPFGVDVVLVAPGAIATPIWGKAEAIDIEPYRGSPWYAAAQKAKDMMVSLGKHGLPPERVGEVVLQALTADHPKVRYEIRPDRLTGLVFGLMPKRMLDRAIAKRLGLLRRS